jgi:geranylgeranyl diphosphate synthase type I
LTVAVVAEQSAPAPGGVVTGVPEPLNRHLPLLVDGLHRSAIPTTTAVGLMASYHVGWTDSRGRRVQANSGKFFRGCLALWAAECCGGSAGDALPVATAVEWMHNFTLVHDDIQDGDLERRHRPTVWAVFGEAQAINAGDGLHAIAYRALLEGRDHPVRRLRAAASLNRGVLAVIEGQCLDLDLEGKVETTPATYCRMARGKTGALIGAALEAAAILSGARGMHATQLRRAGVELGLAFQVRDDWLGIWGDSALTGKGRGDLGRRKVTYAVVAAHQALSGSARREFRRLYADPEADEARIRDLLDQSRAAAVMTDALLRHTGNAVALAQTAGLSREGLDDFACIVSFIAERTS